MSGLPEVVRIYNQYSSQGLMVVGVHDSAGAFDQIAQAIREKGINYPVMRDTDTRETFAGYHILGIPHLILVGRDGTVLVDGGSIAQVEERIKQELGLP